MLSQRAAEIVAFIGAAAWIPQILGWLYRFLVRPNVVITLGPPPEVGFTPEFGPIVNLTVGLTAKRKDALITAMRLEVTHASGAANHLVWKWLQQDKGTLAGTIGGIPAPADLRFQLQDVAIALKVTTQEVLTRKVGFQDPEFQDEMRSRAITAVNQFNYIKAHRQPIRDFFDSREFEANTRWFSDHMPWRTGRYTLTLEVVIDGVRRAALKQATVTLSEPEVELMVRNRDLADRYYRAIAAQNYKATAGPVPPEDDAEPVTQWDWVYPRLS